MTCKRCRKDQTDDQFGGYINTKGQRGKRQTCKTCIYDARRKRNGRYAAKGRAWKQNNPVSLSLSQAKSRADGKGLPIDVDRSYLDAIYSQQDGRCAVTGLPFDLTIGSPFRPSLDRIDSTGGYTKGNVRFVASYVNYALQEHGLDLFLQVAEAAVAYAEAAKQAA